MPTPPPKIASLVQFFEERQQQQDQHARRQSRSSTGTIAVPFTRAQSESPIRSAGGVLRTAATPPPVPPAAVLLPSKQQPSRRVSAPVGLSSSSSVASTPTRLQPATRASPTARLQTAQTNAQFRPVQARRDSGASSAGYRGRSPFTDPGAFSHQMPTLSQMSSRQSPAISKRGTVSGAASMSELIDDVLEAVCEQEEQNRLAAVETFLNLENHVEKSALIEVTKDCAPELKEASNSQLLLSASIYPIPDTQDPRALRILICQLASAVILFRVAACRYGASAVTHIRYLEPPPGTPTSMCRMTAYVVQEKTFGPDGPQSIAKMDSQRPYRDYKKYTLPEDILPQDTEYEILIERY